MEFLPLVIALIGWTFLYFLSINNAYRAEAKDSLKEYLKSTVEACDSALDTIVELEKFASSEPEFSDILRAWNASVLNRKSYLLAQRNELINRYEIKMNDEDFFWNLVDEIELPIEYSSRQAELIGTLNDSRRNISINLNRLIKNAHSPFYQKFPKNPKTITNKATIVLITIAMLFLIAA